MNRIWVSVAGEDRRVPVEGRRGVYFEHDKKHHVRNTPFVQRRIAEGDLKETDSPADLAADVAAAEAAVAETHAELSASDQEH